MNSYEVLKSEVEEIAADCAVRATTIGHVMKLNDLLKRIGNLESSKGCVAKHPWSELRNKINAILKKESFQVTVNQTTTATVQNTPRFSNDELVDIHRNFAPAIAKFMERFNKRRKR